MDTKTSYDHARELVRDVEFLLPAQRIKLIQRISSALQSSYNIGRDDVSRERDAIDRKIRDLTKCQIG